MMNSAQIDKILSKFAPCYKGIYASNNIQKHQVFPYGIVANTDKMHEKGTHWVAFYVPNENEVEFFDSFGEEPNEDHENFLKNFNNVKTNKYKLQSAFDISCGAHVIYFLVMRCRGYSFEKIINNLNHNFSDTMVKIFVYKLLHSI